MTPRQISGHVALNLDLDRREKSDALWIAAHAARGDVKKVEKTIKDWMT